MGEKNPRFSESKKGPHSFFSLAKKGKDTFLSIITEKLDALWDDILVAI